MQLFISFQVHIGRLKSAMVGVCTPCKSGGTTKHGFCHTETGCWISAGTPLVQRHRYPVCPVIVVQSLSCVGLFETPWTAAHQASLSFTIFQTLLKLMSIESAMPSNHLILCHSFFSCPQFSPASGCFPMSWLFASGGQSIRASASVIPLNIQGWFPLWLTGFVSLLSKGLSEVFFSTTIRKYQFFSTQPSLWSNSYICTWLLEKPQLWLDGPLSASWCLCFLICCNMHEIWPL